MCIVRYVAGKFHDMSSQ